MLPPSSELEPPRSLKISRTLTHFHTPYSYDACDKAGISDGVVNGGCMDNLRAAFCKNHIDFAFLTDHPSNMANYEMSELLLQKSGDTIVTQNSLPIANQLGGCEDGHVPTVLVGFEGRMMALGMTRHLSTDASTRGALYGGESIDLTSQIRNGGDAIVAIPHTESRGVDLIKSLNPDLVEIYNVHANLDPKIRKRDLAEPPFENFAEIISYLVDPWSSTEPDFVFLSFFKIHSVYLKRWNQLVASGLKIGGIVGSDSHENIFPQRVADGERLDSHRRISRFISNYVFSTATDVASIKAALRAGRSWTVTEGLATPVGADFSATVGSATVGSGETLKLSTAATLRLTIPRLHARTLRGFSTPVLRAVLKRANSDGTDTTVASSDGANITFETSQAGAYRAEIHMKPLHLKDQVGAFSAQTSEEYPWIITNHVYLVP